jgi:hypothetical protein
MKRMVVPPAPASEISRDIGQSVARVPWLGSTQWRLVILDEAQAIKNPAAKQPGP